MKSMSGGGADTYAISKLYLHSIYGTNQGNIHEMSEHMPLSKFLTLPAKYLH